MKPDAHKALEKYRVQGGLRASGPADGNNGVFEIPLPKKRRGSLLVVVSDGAGWDHVSVSCADRVPVWREMCWIKDMFFDPEEIALQYHPPVSMYVNLCRFCLHLWRPQPGASFSVIDGVPVPPLWMV